MERDRNGRRSNGWREKEGKKGREKGIRVEKWVG